MSGSLGIKISLLIIGFVSGEILNLDINTQKENSYVSDLTNTPKYPDQIESHDNQASRRIGRFLRFPTPPSNELTNLVPTYPPDSEPINEYPIWKIHKYQGIDLKPVKIIDGHAVRDCGSSIKVCDPAGSISGNPPLGINGHPLGTYGSPLETHGPPLETYGPPLEAYEPPLETYGSPLETYGPPLETYGPPLETNRPLLKMNENNEFEKTLQSTVQSSNSFSSSGSDTTEALNALDSLGFLANTLPNGDVSGPSPQFDINKLVSLLPFLDSSVYSQNTNLLASLARFLPKPLLSNLFLGSGVTSFVSEHDHGVGELGLWSFLKSLVSLTNFLPPELQSYSTFQQAYPVGKKKHAALLAPVSVLGKFKKHIPHKHGLFDKLQGGKAVTLSLLKLFDKFSKFDVVKGHLPSKLIKLNVLKKHGAGKFKHVDKLFETLKSGLKKIPSYFFDISKGWTGHAILPSIPFLGRFTSLPANNDIYDIYGMSKLPPLPTLPILDSHRFKSSTVGSPYVHVSYPQTAPSYPDGFPIVPVLEMYAPPQGTYGLPIHSIESYSKPDETNSLHSQFKLENYELPKGLNTSSYNLGEQYSSYPYSSYPYSSYPYSSYPYSSYPYSSLATKINQAQGSINSYGVPANSYIHTPPYFSSNDPNIFSSTNFNSLNKINSNEIEASTNFRNEGSISEESIEITPKHLTPSSDINNNQVNFYQPESEVNYLNSPLSRYDTDMADSNPQPSTVIPATQVLRNKQIQSKESASSTSDEDIELHDKGVTTFPKTIGGFQPSSRAMSTGSGYSKVSFQKLASTQV